MQSGLAFRAQHEPWAAWPGLVLRLVQFCVLAYVFIAEETVPVENKILMVQTMCIIKWWQVSGLCRTCLFLKVMQDDEVQYQDNLRAKTTDVLENYETTIPGKPSIHLQLYNSNQLRRLNQFEFKKKKIGRKLT